MTFMLSKRRSRFLIHKRGDLWLYLTKMSPCASKIWESRQAYPSHWSGNHDVVAIGKPGVILRAHSVRGDPRIQRKASGEVATVYTDFFKWNYLKILPCVCFIRLGGRHRCFENEKGAMELTRLKNTNVYLEYNINISEVPLQR